LPPAPQSLYLSRGVLDHELLQNGGPVVGHHHLPRRAHDHLVQPHGAQAALDHVGNRNRRRALFARRGKKNGPVSTRTTRITPRATHVLLARLVSAKPLSLNAQRTLRHHRVAHCLQAPAVSHTHATLPPPDSPPSRSCSKPKSESRVFFGDRPRWQLAEWTSWCGAAGWAGRCLRALLFFSCLLLVLGDPRGSSEGPCVNRCDRWLGALC
jgi:hypothetical protein